MGAFIFLGAVLLLLVVIAGIRQRRVGRDSKHTAASTRADFDSRNDGGWY